MGQRCIRDLLRRREYAGEVTLNGVVIGPSAFAAIIKRDVFDKVSGQLPMTPQPWRELEETGLLTGLLVCEVCGTLMRRGRGARTERMYSCRGHRGSCYSKLSVAADKAVFQAVNIKRREIEAGGSWRSTQAGAIEHEIRHALRRHSQGALTRAELDSVLKHLRGRLTDERRQPSEAQTAVEPEAWVRWTLNAKRD